MYGKQTWIRGDGLLVLGACAGEDTSQTDAAQGIAATWYRRAPVRGPLTSAYVPRAIDQTPMTVVAILDGPSVSTLQEAAARKLTRAEKDAAKAQRVAEQAVPRARIEASGGTILGSFQSALNGIKLRIPRGQLDALRRIPGVVDVKRVLTYTHDNFVGVQRIQAPFAWAGVSGVHGEGVKVAIIDTGIDYTHADFGGPGTRAAFDAAFDGNVPYIQSSPASSTKAIAVAATSTPAFAPSVTNAAFITVAPNTSSFLSIAVDQTEFALTPARGLMIVTPDNKNGPAEAQLIKLKR